MYGFLTCYQMCFKSLDLVRLYSTATVSVPITVAHHCGQPASVQGEGLSTVTWRTMISPLIVIICKIPQKIPIQSLMGIISSGFSLLCPVCVAFVSSLGPVEIQLLCMQITFNSFL